MTTPLLRLTTEEKLEKISLRRTWHDEPVFCFTTDIDWASETVLQHFFQMIEGRNIKLTSFVTHPSSEMEQAFSNNTTQRGIHPNFLAGSSHGSNYREVIEYCAGLAPEARGCRCHRLFDVTDITHLLYNDFGFEYISNLGTVMTPHIVPMLHESGLIHLPVFFEDGTHLYNKLDLSIERYRRYFETPGLKIINMHPMHLVFNSPTLSFMRSIKDSMPRASFQQVDEKYIEGQRHKGTGIADTMKEIIDWVLRKNYQVYSLEDIYRYAMA